MLFVPGDTYCLFAPPSTAIPQPTNATTGSAPVIASSPPNSTWNRPLNTQTYVDLIEDTLQYIDIVDI